MSTPWTCGRWLGITVRAVRNDLVLVLKKNSVEFSNKNVRHSFYQKISRKLKLLNYSRRIRRKVYEGLPSFLLVKLPAWLGSSTVLCFLFWRRGRSCRRHFRPDSPRSENKIENIRGLNILITACRINWSPHHYEPETWLGRIVPQLS